MISLRTLLKVLMFQNNEPLTAFFHKHFAYRLANASGCSEHRLLFWTTLFISNYVFIFHSQLIGILQFCWLCFPVIRENVKKMDDYWIFTDLHKEVPANRIKRSPDLGWKNVDFTQTDQLLTVMCSKSPTFLWASVFCAGQWSD